MPEGQASTSVGCQEQARPQQQAPRPAECSASRDSSGNGSPSDGAQPEQPSLALAELSRTAGLVATVLLALDFPRIPRHEPVLTQDTLKALVLQAQRACNAEARSSGLTRNAAALDVDPDVIRVARFRCDQGLQRCAASVLGHEEGGDLLAVDDELAGARLDADSGSRRLATTSAPNVRVVDYHDLESLMIAVRCGRMVIAAPV